MSLAAILGAAGVAIAALVALLVGKSRKLGAAEATGAATAEAQKKVDDVIMDKVQTEVKQVEKANETHDRLDADPAYRQRVRDRFTRD